ncbi:hypothetical protein RCL1_008206 [Eukaryota sp. TZLM3-RCL]
MYTLFGEVPDDLSDDQSSNEDVPPFTLLILRLTPVYSLPSKKDESAPHLKKARSESPSDSSQLAGFYSKPELQRIFGDISLLNKIPESSILLSSNLLGLSDTPIFYGRVLTCDMKLSDGLQ